MKSFGAFRLFVEPRATTDSFCSKRTETSFFIRLVVHAKRRMIYQVYVYNAVIIA